MLENVFFDVYLLRVEEGGISQNLFLVGVKASKPICTLKFVTQPSTESPEQCCVSERVDAIFYMYRCTVEAT